MRKNEILLMKRVSHIVLFGLSAFLSVNLFLQLGNNIYESVVFGLIAFVFEIIKLYLFILAKSDLKKKEFKSMLVGSIKLTIYIILAIASIAASLGFVLNVIENQNFVATTKNYEKQALVQEMNAIDFQIQNKLLQQADVATNKSQYITGTDRLSEQIKELQNEKKKIIEKINSMDMTLEQESSSSFELIGRAINADGQKVRFWILLGIVFVLEITLILTASNVDEGTGLRKLQYNLIAYVEALLDIDKGKVRVNNHDYISRKTGFTKEQCNEYKNILKELEYKGNKLFEIRKGAGMVPKFSKDNIVKIIKMKSDLE